MGLLRHVKLSCAHEQGVEVLSLTDHDTTEGLIQAQQAAQEVGITLITGIEMSWYMGRYYPYSGLRLCIR